METVLSLLSDLTILIFDLALYVHLTALRKEDPLHRAVMYSGTVLITLAYVLSAYVWQMPYGIASFVCMTIPSFLLFFCLSRYKNARFLVTFCCVDTVTLILASVAKIILILGGETGALVSFVLLAVLCAVTYLLLQPYFARYRALMEQVSEGWGPIAVSTVLIYLLLVGFMAFPRPLRDRMEYTPLYLLLCVTMISFYGVFITLLLQKSKLMQANLQLQQQQHWHDLAYVDGLTRLSNSAAYAARTEEIEKERSGDSDCAVMLFDIDHFKAVNDTYGHLYGNTVLQKTADFFRASFPEEHFEIFRVGGDEFAVISTGISRAEIDEKARWINTMSAGQGPGCTCSCGYAMVDFQEENAFRRAFQQADEAMYAVKNEKKHRA